MSALKYIIVILLLYHVCYSNSERYRTNLPLPLIRHTNMSKKCTIRYIITNTSCQEHLIFFVEECVDSKSQIKALRRKLYRRYGDFSFSMVEWDPNMEISKENIVTLELFHKILKPNESFTVVVPCYAKDEEKAKLLLDKHLLICTDAMFRDYSIQMPDFIEKIKAYDFSYKDKQIIVPLLNLIRFSNQ